MADSIPLGILKDVAALPSAEPFLPVWEKMHQRELRLAINHPPENIYEEMINWTNEGKLWKFPINNYQGLF
jgi:small subunit ribosomal protein S31